MEKLIENEIFKKVIARIGSSDVDSSANQFRKMAVAYAAVNAINFLKNKSPLLLTDMDKHVPLHLREEAMYFLEELGLVNKNEWKQKTAWTLS